MSDNSSQIDNVMQENRLFPPSQDFASKASIGSLEQYQELYDQAKDDPEGFWDEVGKNELHWFEPLSLIHI